MNRTHILLGFILGFVAFMSLRTLTSQPRYFYDEALVIETAHNLADHGKLDIMVSPGVLSNYGHLFNATGYTVTLPLAIIFKLSHVSFTFARLMMLAWLLAVMVSTYLVTKSFWNHEAGLAASALLATFAPFYGNGMQIMGEIPGFFFLLWGLYFLFHKQRHMLGGFLFGLAAISKPSMYGLLLPTYLLYLVFFDKDRVQKLKDFTIGAAGPVILFFILIVPDIFSLSVWKEMLNLYRNPYESVSLLQNVISNISRYWTHSSILYLFLLFSIIGISFWKQKTTIDPNHKKIYIFFYIYFVFIIFYFLRSPGWFRYLLPGQLLISILIFPMLVSWNRRFALGVTGFLIVLQVFQLFFFRGDIKETFAQDTATYINTRQQSVGVIGALEVASLITPDQRYQIVKYFGVPELGTNPLLINNPRPQLIVFKSSDNPLVEPYRNILDTYYEPLTIIGSYRIYQLKRAFAVRPESPLQMER